jgi:hypothetical protein
MKGVGGGSVKETEVDQQWGAAMLEEASDRPVQSGGDALCVQRGTSDGSLSVRSERKVGFDPRPDWASHSGPDWAGHFGPDFPTTHGPQAHRK